MTGINFSIYPTSNRVPGVYFEIDNSQANTGTLNQRALLIGQMTSDGTATQNIPTISAGVGDAVTQFGSGSMLAAMVEHYRSVDYFGELWCLPLADNGAGTAWTGSITVNGTATGAGTLSLYIGGQLVQTGVSIGDSASAIASNIHAQALLNPKLPVTLGNPAGAVFTMAAKHRGIEAGDIDLRANYRGSAGGEVYPAGVTVTFATLTAGAGNPLLPPALANLGAVPYDYIIMPYADPTSVADMNTFFSDSNGRWSYLYELFGMGFNAYRGTFSGQTTFGQTNNGQHMSTIGFFDSPDPVWIWATDFGAVAASSLRADPALPLQTLAMNVKAPPPGSRFSLGERNTLYYDGISSFTVDNGGVVRLERAVTNYQTNGAGAPDNSYLDVETLATLQFYVRDLRTDLQSKFARKKLVSDATRVSFGQNFVTSSTVLGEAIAHYRKFAAQGLVQNPDVFAQQATATNAGNGQVSLALPVQLAGQLRIIATLVQFTKP